MHALPDLSPLPAYMPLWEEAEASLARLDQLVLDSGLQDTILERLRFEEVCAAIGLEGELISREDLVLHDAGTPSTLPDQTLFLARLLLRAWRSTSRLGADELLSVQGILELRERALAVVEHNPRLVADGLLPQVVSQEELSGWLEDLRATEKMPALIGAGWSVSAWDDLALLPRLNAGFGRLLGSSWLLQRGKLSRPLPFLSLGYRDVRWVYHPTRSPEATLEWFLRAVIAGSNVVRDLISHLQLSQERFKHALSSYRRGSHAGAVLDLALRKPVISLPLVASEVGLSKEGARLLLRDLAARGLIQELTGRRRYRVWSIPVPTYSRRHRLAGLSGT